MRVSAIADWTTCEAMALSDPRPEARVHVAAWVGTLAHGFLSEKIPAPPLRLRFDPITQTAEQAFFQAGAIAKESDRILSAAGWSIMEAEREVAGNGDTGHLDIAGMAWGDEAHGDHRPQDWTECWHGLAPGRRAISTLLGRWGWLYCQGL